MTARRDAPAHRTRTVYAATALLGAACFLGTPAARGGDARSKPEQLVMKLGSVAARGSPLGAQLHALAQHVERVTEGRIRVKLLLGGTLGDEATLVTRTHAGTLQAYAGSTAALARIAPEFEVLGSPYLFANDAKADRALDGAARRALAADLPRTGVRFAAWGVGDFRVWFTRSRAIRRPADLAGLRVETGDSAAARATGAVLWPGATRAAPTASQQADDAPDAFEDTLLDGVVRIRERGIRHATLTRHAYAANVIVYSEAWFVGLPEQVQRDLSRIPDALVRDARGVQRALRPRLLELLAERGVEVTEPSRSEQAAFERATRDVARRLALPAGPPGWKLLRAAGR